MNENAIDHTDDSVLGSDVLGSDVSDEAIEAAADTERARQQMSLMVSGPVGYPDFCC